MKTSLSITSRLALAGLLIFSLQHSTAFIQSGSYTNWDNFVTHWTQTGASGVAQGFYQVIQRP
jgi:hypothetical protein